MTEIKYRIFVIFHDELNVNYYDTSMLNNYVFINVRPGNKNKYDGFTIINLQDFSTFKSLGKWYTESEVIYNIYRNPAMISDVDYIGFLQYDIDSSPLTHTLLQNHIEKYELISFEPHLFGKDYRCNFLMDEKKPNTLIGKGQNCYDEIFKDFNNFYQTNFASTYYLGHTICLCSSFVTHKLHFQKMMQFASTVIESGKLDKFDTLHIHRIQGGFLERYYGVWFMLQNIPFGEVKLVHNYTETNNKKALKHRLYKKFISFFVQ